MIKCDNCKTLINEKDAWLIELDNQNDNLRKHMNKELLGQCAIKVIQRMKCCDACNKKICDEIRRDQFLNTRFGVEILREKNESLEKEKRELELENKKLKFELEFFKEQFQFKKESFSRIDIKEVEKKFNNLKNEILKENELELTTKEFQAYFL